MTTLITHIAEFQAATAFGAAGLAAQMVWPLVRRRQTVLMVQLTAAACHAASYTLIGYETAAAVCMTGAVQTAVTLLAGDHPRLRHMGLAFLPVVIALGALTYAGLPTILAVTACCLTMIGRMQASMLRLRAVQLTAAPLGITHDVLIGAWPALGGALLSFALAGAGLCREIRHRRAAAMPAPAAIPTGPGTVRA